MSKLEKEKSSSSSSSTDFSSEEDFIQLDASELNKSITDADLTVSHVGDGAELASEVDTRIEDIAGSSNLSPENGIQNPDNFSILGAPEQSLSIQVKERLDVSDPYRIPPVFVRSKSTTPAECSVASNESSFGTHVGNPSFSRDHVFLLGRSGELGEFSYSPSDAYPPNPMVSDSSSARNLAEANDFERAIATEAANAVAMKHVLRAAADEHAEKDHSPAEGIQHSASTSRRSEASSIQSFAFPILTGEGRSDSLRVVPEQQPQLQMQKQPEAVQQETSKVVPSAGAHNKWFSCFSCSSCC